MLDGLGAAMTDVRFAILPPEKSSFEDSIALSPDRRKLAFVASSGDTASLWLRPLESLSPQVLPGRCVPSLLVAGCRWIAFFAEGKLKKI